MTHEERCLLAAAIERLAGHVPPAKLAAVLDAWADRLDALAAEESAGRIQIVHHVHRGRHSRLRLDPDLRY